MKSVCAAIVVLSIAGSAARIDIVSKPVVKKGNVGPHAFLGQGCKVGSPDCGETVNMVLKVNEVLHKATEVEKKAENAESEAKGLVESVAEVKAAKKEEASETATQEAAKEQLEIVQEEVKKEETEVKEKEQVVEKEKEEAKKATAPAAKELLKEEEAEMEEEIHEEVIEAEVKQEEVKAVEQKTEIVAMKAVTTRANVAAKEEEFKSEQKAVATSEELFDPKAVFKVEIAVYNVQKEVVKAASAAPAATAGEKPTEAEQIKNAELPKVNLAVQVITTAKLEADEAKKEEKKAEEQMEEVVDDTKTEKMADTIISKFETVEHLEEVLEKCEACTDPVPAAAPAAAAAPVTLKVHNKPKASIKHATKKLQKRVSHKSTKSKKH